MMSEDETHEELKGSITNESEERKDYRLGVLLVHGIGKQPSGEALSRWGDVLLKTIQKATCNHVKVRVGEAGRRRGNEEGPLSAEVWLQSSHEEKPWLLADGWWADAFLPPSYKELVSWSIRALPWAIAIHIAQGYWQVHEKAEAAKATEGAPRLLRHSLSHIVASSIAVIQLLFALALAPVCLLLLALTLPIGLLPIPQVRSLILAAQGTLVSTVGDSLAFGESPVRAALIRTRILERLSWLKKKCEKTIVVAHSQGAAVVMDALGAIGETIGDTQWLQKLAKSPEPPDTLVTFGAGTNQLASLKSLSTGDPLNEGTNPVTSVMITILAFAGVVGWLAIATFRHQTTLIDIFRAGVINIIFLAGYALVSWMFITLFGWLQKHWGTFEKHKNVLRGAFALVLTVIWLLAVVFAHRSKLPVFSVFFIFMLLLLAVAVAMNILSNKMKKAVTLVKAPLALHRWLDLYASADPVPHGKTRTASVTGAGPAFTSTRIWNLGSFFSDHTAYWKNIDGFVLPVVRACAETAASPWKDELPLEASEPEKRAEWKRAEWRVSWLRFARRTVYLSWLVIGAALWFWHWEDIPVPFTVPRWLPPFSTSIVRFAVLAVGSILSAFITSVVLQWLWQRWTLREQDAVLNHKLPPFEFWPLVRIGYLVWLTLFIAVFVVRNSWTLAFSDFGSLMLAFCAPPVGAAFLSTFALLYLKPAPPPTNYISTRGAERLREKMVQLRSTGENNAKKIAKLEQLLASVSVVQPPEKPRQGVGFGARVTVRNAEKQLRSYRILGVDELDIDSDAESWMSKIGQALLGAEVGKMVILKTGESQEPVRIVKVEY